MLVITETKRKGTKNGSFTWENTPTSKIKRQWAVATEKMQIKNADPNLIEVLPCGMWIKETRRRAPCMRNETTRGRSKKRRRKLLSVGRRWPSILVAEKKSDPANNIRRILRNFLILLINFGFLKFTSLDKKNKTKYFLY